MQYLNAQTWKSNEQSVFMYYFLQVSVPNISRHHVTVSAIVVQGSQDGRIGYSPKTGTKTFIILGMFFVLRNPSSFDDETNSLLTSA